MLVIAHTSDLHGGMPERLLNWLKEIRSLPNSLLLDSGDAVSAGNLGFRLRGEPVLRLMGEVGYDAMCVGNREFHPIPALFRHKVRDASFPLLSANLKGGFLPVLPHMVREVGGFGKVAVVGLSVPMHGKLHPVAWLTGVYFDDPIRTAQEAVFEARSKADLVVLLTHVGLKMDMLLAAYANPDLILGGHSHRALPRPLRFGNTWIVHSGFHGRMASLVTVRRIDGGFSVESELVRFDGGG